MRRSSSIVCGTLPWNSSLTTAARALQGLRLVAEEAGGADQFFQLGEGGGGHRLGRGEGLEERGGDEIDADVGTLRGEDGGDEELPRALVVEGADGVGVGFLQGVEDGGDAGGVGGGFLGHD